MNMGENDTKILADDQLEHFNTELMIPKYWDVFNENLVQHIRTDKYFEVLDIGGGNGAFADALIRRFPMLVVTVLDNSEYLLSHNKPHPRKKLIYGSATELDKVLGERSYDLISFNWVLHHLVGETRRQSLDIVRNTLSDARLHLNPGGVISVVENLYPGLVFDRYPGAFIFRLTNIRWQPAADFVRRVGFNTAGVGVDFMSPKLIRQLIDEAGLYISTEGLYDRWGYNPLIRLGLLTKPMRMENLWLRAAY